MAKSSKALDDLMRNLEEIKILQDCVKIPKNTLPTPQRIRLEYSVNRAALVLLSSFFERYIYNVNEEICDWINANKILASNLPKDLRLQHAKQDIDSIYKKNWDNRFIDLENYNLQSSWLFENYATGKLQHTYLLVWMKAPNIENIVRYYRLWGIDNIFAQCADLQKPIEGRYRYRIGEMVKKRNSIAHGDPNTNIDGKPLEASLRCVRLFCQKADKIILNNIHAMYVSSLYLDIDC